MTLDDLKADIASDIPSDGTPQFGIILLMVIGALVSEIVHWIFKRYTDEREAAAQCVVYFQHFGPIKRVALIARAVAMKHRFGAVSTSNEKIVDTTVGKLRTLSADDFLALAKNIGAA